MARDEFVDLLDDIVAAIGFRHEAPVIRKRLGTWTMIGRGNQERDVRPALLNVFGKSQSIHGTRHVDVCEEDLHVVGARFKNRQGDIGIGSLKNMKAGILQVVGRRHTHKRLVFDQQNDKCLV